MVLVWLVFFPGLVLLRLCVLMFFEIIILGLSCLGFLLFLIQSTMECTTVQGALETVFMLTQFFMYPPQFIVPGTVLGAGGWGLGAGGRGRMIY